MMQFVIWLVLNNDSNEYVIKTPWYTMSVFFRIINVCFYEVNLGLDKVTLLSAHLFRRRDALQKYRTAECAYSLCIGCALYSLCIGWLRRPTSRDRMLFKCIHSVTASMDSVSIGVQKEDVYLHPDLEFCFANGDHTEEFGCLGHILWTYKLRFRC